MKKNQRGEMRGRCREQREGGDAESRGALNVCLGLENILFILVFLSGGLVEPVRFNLFQTLKTETEPNRNFFVIF